MAQLWESKMTAPFVDIGNGHRLYVRDWGSGQPVLLLSGWAMDSRSWGETMVHLNAFGFRTIAYDRRGHGRSTDPGIYDYDTLADDLGAIIEQLDLTDMVLVGHSGAGGEIIRYLSRHGASRVGRLVLVGATGPSMVAKTPDAVGIPGALVETAVARIIDDLSGWIAENIGPFAPDADKGTLQWLDAMPRDTSRRALVDFQRAILTTDFTDESRNISVPVRLIHGDRDVSAPLDWTARKYAEIIPTSELCIYEGVAHGVMITHARRLAADIAGMRVSE
jgi:non-heme chloroperoxidase